MKIRVIKDLKIKKIKVKNMVIVKIYLGISLELLQAVWGSVQFQIVPCSSLYFSRFVGPFQSSQTVKLQGFNLLHLSLPKWIPLFILASSVCRSLQCLISALTQGGEGGYLFRLIYSVVLWGGRNTANKYHWHVWGRSQCLGHTGFVPSHRECVLSQSTVLRL